METSFDNQAPSSLDTLDTTLPVASTEIPEQAQSQTQSEDSAEPTVETQAYSPFAGGKEKFKVNGKEVEWDWDTTKKYAQLGNAAYQKLEQAAATEKKAKEAYTRLYEAAQNDPLGLIKTLNPNWNPQAHSSQAGNLEQPQMGQQVDPLQAKLQELERKLQTYEQKFEAQDIEAERRAIQNELDEAVKKYPELKDEVYTDYVKSQYAKALKAGMEVSLEDVAFHVAQKLREKNAQAVQSKQKKLEEKRVKAPISTGPAAPESKKSEINSFEDVRKLAGLS